MRFNVNHNVRVKLTDRGRECLEGNHKTLFRKRQFPPPYQPPEEDEDGWSTWQLWVLMEQLGPHVHNGLDVPFETEIEILTDQST